LTHPAALELRTVLGEHDTFARRRLTRDAVEAGAPLHELAAEVVAYADDMILRGMTDRADEVIWQAVHDGVPPHRLFVEIKRLAAPREA
jgi:hypothetical protein